MTQRDLSGWLPNMLGPVELRADDEAITPRGVIDFVNSTIVDVEPSEDEPLGKTTITLGSDGIVGADTASFGQEGDALSYVFRYSTTVDTTDTLASVDLSYGEALYDIVITINGKKRLAADAFQQDHRIKRTRTANGAPTLFGTDVTGTAEASGVLATAAVVLDFFGNILRIRVDPNTADDIDWTVTVQAQITRDVT